MKILITGASGTIGSVLLKCLSKKHDVVGVDKIPSNNVVTLDIVNERKRLRELLKNVDAVIHLAWDVKEAGSALGISVAKNKIIGETMYALSLEQNVKKFILASSVHASFGHINYRHPGIVEDHNILHEKKITTRNDYFPLGIYGLQKCILKRLEKHIARKGCRLSR